MPATKAQNSRKTKKPAKATSIKPQLIIRDLDYTYHNQAQSLHVLDSINVNFSAGQLYAIKGESGSGKTTFLSLIAGLDLAEKGDILYGDRSVRSIGLQEFRLKYVNIVFQSFNLIKYMTAAENIEVAIDFAGHHEDPAHYLEKVGLSKTEGKRFVNQLSGGQQQRVAIARALASNAPIIVADEPTGNLDEDTEAKIIALFQALAHQEQKIVILVTHSQKVAAQADKVYTLSRGKLASGCSPA